MKLKDYIHYYYGCDFIANGVRYTIDRIDRLIKGTRQNPYGREVWNDFEPHKIKLVLRRLEDMTEGEAKFILDNYSFCSVDMPMNERKFAIEIAKRLVNQMPVAHYLLQQHFDLFGLIAAGVAVEKTLK